MPLLDSFMVDHTKMNAPAIRVAKTMKTKGGDTISVFDLRFYVPNVDKMGVEGMHTLEHLFAGFIRNYLNSSDVEVIDCSPMGCRTGFYMSVIGAPLPNDVASAVLNSMKDVLKVKSESDIPELNIYQCGTYDMHSLSQAKQIAQDIIDNGVGIMDNDALALDEDKLGL